MKLSFPLVFLLCLSLPALGAERSRTKGKRKSHPLLPVFEKGTKEPDSRGIISLEMSGRDLEFLTSSVEIASIQEWLGEKATERADSEQVKAVGEALQSTLADEKAVLQRLAASQGIQRDAQAAKGAAVGKLEAALKDLSGPKFDKRIMEEIESAVARSVELYRVGTQSDNAEIKRYTEQLLPLSKDKLQIVRKVSGISSQSSQPALRGNAVPRKEEPETQKP